MLTRREFLRRSVQASLIAAAGPYACVRTDREPAGAIVNDIHSQLNATPVARIERPASPGELHDAMRRARAAGRPVSIAGGRHAMGGQQFGTDTTLIDMNRMNKVVSFDAQRGIVEAEAGIQWPELIDWLTRRQSGSPAKWAIRQKQTGADRLSLGGALAANAHSRGLRMKPMVGEVESFTLMGPDGTIRTCSRTENADLFRLVIGGYGLFGIITTVRLRLGPRHQVERVVEIIDLEALMPMFNRRISEGFEYGDFQFMTDEASDDFLERGVFSCYRPLDGIVPLPATRQRLSASDWRDLLYLAHADKKAGFERYSSYYLATSGQIYWSDTHQMSTYLDDYHLDLDRKLAAPHRGSEMITEIYVPREALVPFLRKAGQDFKENGVSLIYGTIRLIETDDESFLAWARQPYACTIFNLHVEHTESGIARSARDFGRLIDLAIRFDGSYFLTYHRWASRNQIAHCYPRFVDFMKLKQRYDPGERFQSDWYRHHKAMFSHRL